MRRESPKGFTLIELMIVCAIIGILSTVAYPAYKFMAAKAKRTERAIHVTNFVRTLRDMYNDKGQAFPGGGFLGLLNPPLVGIANSSQKTFNKNQAGWTQLSYAPDGPVRYYYQIEAASGNGWGLIVVWATGDMDDDRNVSTYEEVWANGSECNGFIGKPCNDWQQVITQETCSTGSTTCY
jgi:prepilin-type N-terminal cleavage/methylation domain-containing protein